MLPQNEKACGVLCGYTIEELRIKSVWSMHNRSIPAVGSSLAPYINSSFIIDLWDLSQVHFFEICCEIYLMVQCLFISLIKYYNLIKHNLILSRCLMWQRGGIGSCSLQEASPGPSKMTSLGVVVPLFTTAMILSGTWSPPRAKGNI